MSAFGVMYTSSQPSLGMRTAKCSKNTKDNKWHIAERTLASHIPLKNRWSNERLPNIDICAAGNCTSGRYSTQCCVFHQSYAFLDTGITISVYIALISKRDSK